MEDGGDIISFKDEVTTELDAISGDLPEDAEEPSIRQLGQTFPVLVVLVTGEMSVVDLKAYCEDLKQRMQRTPGISLVEVSGFSDHQFRVEVSTASLQRFGLSVQDDRCRLPERFAKDWPFRLQLHNTGIDPTA